MNQDHDDHDKHRGRIVDDKVLDFSLYEKITKNDLKRKVYKGGKGGCLGIVVMLLLPAASVMCLWWKY
ncbi:MAG: hypothetical protein JZU65_13995 [Chlorobium sp.]|nr:hypothetical protein [Chlorobium sp.]